MKEVQDYNGGQVTLVPFVEGLLKHYKYYRKNQDNPNGKKERYNPHFFVRVAVTQSPKWLGKCPQCNEWNTFVEEVTISKEK